MAKTAKAAAEKKKGKEKFAELEYAEKEGEKK